MVIMWLALNKIGCPAAFINCQLRGAALVHSIKVSSANIILFQHNIGLAIKEILTEVQDGHVFFEYLPRGAAPAHEAFVPRLTEQEIETFENKRPDQALTDSGMFVE